MVDAITAPSTFLSGLRTLPTPQEVNYRFNAVSLFCGGGGLDLGMALAGFDVKFASDVESIHCDTITHNFSGCVAEPFDVRELTGQRIHDLSNIGEIDIVFGGPPCQAFSILGKRNSLDDPRGQLVYDYVRLIRELQPRVFLFENVPGLLTLNKGKDWETLLQYIREQTHAKGKQEYRLSYAVLNAADFGVPQVRKRVFIIGFREDPSQFEFPVPTHRQPDLTADLFTSYLPTWISSRFALENVDGVANHRIRPHGDRVRQRYEKLAPGERDKVDHTDRIHPDKPAGTVLVGSKGGGGRPHIHPFEPRHITVREAARLQSFPDWYVFQGTDTWQYRAVGNAVPPLLAKALGEQITQCLIERKR